MKRELLDRYLCCPVDYSYPLQIEAPEWHGDELMSGRLRCPKCASEYPVVAGIPNMLPSQEIDAREVIEAKKLEMATRDAEAEIYDDNFPFVSNKQGNATYGDFLTMVELDRVLNTLNPKRGEIIMDLGAGTGRLTGHLAKSGATVLATDLSPHSLEVNRAKCARLAGADVHFFASDACHLPVRPESIEKIGSMEMLEHIPSDEQRRRCIDEIYRALQPGGKVALTTYNYSWTKRRRGTREGYHGGTIYFYRMTRDELGKMMRSFRVLSLTGILNVPSQIKSNTLDRLVSAIPPVAELTGDLLFVAAQRKPQTQAR
jgi:ubiquinone/menaquinone biosynthesis C-methylase UbiE/uncharacterized protein YbaR (Trm112 family)